MLEDGKEKGSNYYQNEILYSIAISLKRIADILQGKQQPVIMSAEEYARYQESLK